MPDGVAPCPAPTASSISPSVAPSSVCSTKTPIAVIARELDRHHATIHREIRRNHVHGPREYAGYYPLNAQDRAVERRKRQRKLGRNLALRDTIVAGLERCWSPEQIAGRLRHEAGDGGSVCHETIYRYVYGPEGREAGLHRHLPKARRRHLPRYGRKPRRSSFPASRAIQHRPTEVGDRQTFGHREADLPIFRREHGKANLTSMIERQTRYTILLPNPDRQPNALIGRIGQAWQGLPEGSCRTVTFDRGTEFAAYAVLARTSGTEAFFCDPHSPWQKGAIENTNGRIRHFLPGDRNLAELADDELQRVTTMLKATPRRCLGYRTPNEAFHEQRATLPRAA